MSNSAQAEERRTEIALFRYTLILPLVREPSAQARQQMRRNLAAVVYDLPHTPRRKISVSTLRRWEARYRQGGFEALKPQPRADRGQPRAVSPETLDRAEALKREQPFRSARSIATILAKDNTQPPPEATLAPRTPQRGPPPGPARRDHRATADRTASQSLPPFRALCLWRSVARRCHARAVPA